CGVATGALTAKLLPPSRRGEGLGLLGIVTGIPAIVALPAGIWLAGHHLAAAAAAVAAVTGLAPLAAVRWLPAGRAARAGAAPGPGGAKGARREGGRARPGGGGGCRAAAAADLRRRHRRGRRARLVPAAGDPEQPLVDRPARAGDHGHPYPLAGGQVRRPAR